MNKLTLFAAMLGPLLVASPSLSYNNTVHYFLTVVVTENVDPPLTDNELRLVSFCAQLPDETVEYDAMHQYQKLLKSGDYGRWSRTSNSNAEKMNTLLSDSEAVRELITVQQLLHGLTGGTASEMLATADNILQRLMHDNEWALQERADRTTQLCAIGFGVHLLGDTLAHRRLDSGGLESPGKMYSTGKGHAFDGKKPDNLINSVTGLEGLKRYSGKIPSSFPGTRNLGANELDDFHSQLEAASESFFGASKKSRQVVLDHSGAWAKDTALRPEDHKNEACQTYLNTVISTLAVDQCVPDCEAVFSLYSEIAMDEFGKTHPSRLPTLELDQYFYPAADGDPPVCSHPIT